MNRKQYNSFAYGEYGQYFPSSINSGPPPAPTRVANVSPPIIVGNTVGVGNEISFMGDIWSGTRPHTYQQRWQRSNGSGGWANISGATGLTYTTVEADIGFDIRVQRRGNNEVNQWSAWVSSNTLAIEEAPPEPVAGILTNPPVSARTGIIGERSARPFINHFKQAWEWESDNGQGGGNWDGLRANNHITDGGQIVSIPPGENAGIRTRALDRLIAASGASGHWFLMWDGAGTFDLFGGNNVNTDTPNVIEFDYTANGDSWITVIARSAPISNIRLIHEDDLEDHNLGKNFRKQYLDEVSNYRSLRFDEWVGILKEEPYGLIITDWASRGLPTDEVFTHRYVPYEWQFELCNLVGADPWVCMPTAATDEHFRKAAELAKRHIPAHRHIHVEYSTKTWDFAGTPQAHYCAEQGRIAFGTEANPTNQEFRNWYGMRTAQMGQIWKEVWENDPRLHIVIQHQTDWIDGEYDVLVAPMWREALSPLLNDEPSLNAANITNISETTINIAYTSAGGRRYVTFPGTFPEGTRIEFDMRISNTTYVVLDNEVTLNTPRFPLVHSTGFPAGTHHVDYTVPADAAVSTYIGFLGVTNSTVEVSNWKITRPGLNLPDYVPPHSVADTLTIHAQIDGGMAYGARATELNEWRTTLSQNEAFNHIRNQMLTGQFWEAERVVSDMIPKWNHYRTIANNYGLELSCYEIGNHLNGVGGGDDLINFMHQFSVSPQMGEVYQATFDAVRAAGFDGPIAMSVECRYPDDNTMHGLQRWLGDHNPAWSVVDSINRLNNGPNNRSETDFIGEHEGAEHFEPLPEPEEPGINRVTIQPTESIGMDSHSFGAFPFGYMGDGGGSQEFPDHWSGDKNLTYTGFSSLAQRWALNGPSRTANYTGAGWLAEFADPSGGSWPTPDTSEGQTTLQYLYWWAMLLQQKGCKAMFIMPPHSPEQLPIDANIMSVHQYYVNWLTERPDVTIPVFLMPHTDSVRKIRNRFNDRSIFSDGLHLVNGSTFDVVGAVGMGFWMMMTGEKTPYDPDWNAEFREMIDIIWDDIANYECTGLGGTTVVTPWSGSNPLTNPLPLP